MRLPKELINKFKSFTPLNNFISHNKYTSTELAQQPKRVIASMYIENILPFLKALIAPADFTAFRYEFFITMALIFHTQNPNRRRDFKIFEEMLGNGTPFVYTSFLWLGEGLVAEEKKNDANDSIN